MSDDNPTSRGISQEHLHLLGQSRITIPLVSVTATRPQREGSFIYDSFLDDIYVSDGTQWVLVLSNASTSGQICIESSQASATAIKINASNIVGGIDVDAGTGGVDVDTTGQLNLDSSQVAGTAISLNASNAAGGVNIASGTGGFAAITTGAFDVTSTSTTLSSSITQTGGIGTNLNVTSTSGSILINGGEAASDAIRLNTTNAGGGIDIDAGTSGVDVDTTGQLNLDSSQSAANAIRLNASGVTGGVDVDATGLVRVNSSLTATTNALLLGVAANSGMTFEVGGVASLSLDSDSVDVTNGRELAVSQVAGTESRIRINGGDNTAARLINFQTGGTTDWQMGLPSAGNNFFLDNLNAGLDEDFTIDLGTGQVDTTASNGILLNKGTVTQITTINTAVTIAAPSGIITTVSAPTAAQDNDLFAVINSVVTATSVVHVSIVNYAGSYSTNGLPVVNVSGIGAGFFTMVIMNAHDTNALSGVLKIAFTVF